MKPTIKQIDEAIDDYICGRSNEVITYALRVLKKLMEEPTGEQCISGRNANVGPVSTRPYYIYKAMRDQLLREVE